MSDLQINQLPAPVHAFDWTETIPADRANESETFALETSSIRDALLALCDAAYLGATETAADSSKLGGSAAAAYLLAATAANTYQPILISGTSIKTVNGASLLGSGDLTISGGGGTPGGSSGQVQLNSAGAFGASASLTFSGSTLTVGVPTSALGALALAGSTSGTATIQPPAVAGTPTLTLPASTGTLALTSDIPSLAGYETSAHASSTYQTLAGMSGYLTTSGTAADSDKLGGTAAASYLLASTASSTYQTQAGMSSYLTTASAASTYLGIGAQAADSAALGGTAAASYLLASTASSTYMPKAGGTFTGTVTLTPAANTSALVASGYSLTGSNAQSMLDLSGTWNTSGTPTLILANVTDTASNASSLLMDLQVGGTSKFYVRKDGGFVAGSNNSRVIGNIKIDGILSCYSYMSLNTGGGRQSVWTADAQHQTAFRDGTNAQTLRVYNTYTDASNYERGVFDWGTTANTLTIGTQAAGTGTARTVNFVSGVTVAGAFLFTSGTNGSVAVDSGTNFQASSANPGSGNQTYLGHGMRRANTGGGMKFFWGESITSSVPGLEARPVSGSLTSGGIAFRICESSDASVTLFQVKQGGLAQFGGTTSSYPAIKPSSGILAVRLADDSADAPLTAAAITASGDILRRGANAQKTGVYHLTELTTIAASAYTDTTIQMPAGAIILGVTARVTTAITCTSTFDIGDSGSATRFATGVSKAVNTTSDGSVTPYRNASALSVRITPDTTPSDATGRLRVTIHYLLLNAATS